MESSIRTKIFVFGSNIRGVHGAGSARHARLKYNAKLGIGIGRTGNAYAIPTKDKNIKSLLICEIKPFIDDFIKYAKEHPELDFLIVKIGCGLAGYFDYEIASLFYDIPDNCFVHSDWTKYIRKDYHGICLTKFQL